MMMRHVLLIPLVALVVSLAPTDVRWEQCVLQVHKYFRPLNATAFNWTEPNPCGYTPLTEEMVTAQILFNYSRGVSTYSFSGDSTALRAYIKSVNAYLAPKEPLPILRVANSPRFTQTRKTRGQCEVALRFFRLTYVSMGPSVVKDIISTSNGGFVIFMLGNWDMNWKLQRNQPMPGLLGGVHNFTAAKEYWTGYVQKTVAALREALLAMPVERRPIVMFREQALPNCGASRFTSPRRKYRQCVPFLRPVLVPLYRRTLAPLLWSIGVPVIPVDPLFTQSSVCSMRDGLHLDENCYVMERQILWNVYNFLRSRGVVQGKFIPPAVALPVAADFINATTYDRWHQDFFGAASHENYTIEPFPSAPPNETAVLPVAEASPKLSERAPSFTSVDGGKTWIIMAAAVVVITMAISVMVFR